MGASLDFLWQGSAPPSVNSNSTATTAVPQWLSDYTQGVVAKANSVAAAPYQKYKGTRIAAPDQSLKDGWSMGADAADAYKDNFAQAQTSLGTAANGNASAAAAGSLGTAKDFTSMGGNVDVTGAAQPYMDAASQNGYQTVGNYMNPYTNAVVDQIASKGAQNLRENLLPTMGDDFIRSGQLGSSRHIDAAGRAMAQTQENVSNAQATALNSGYQSAMTAAQTDAQRQAGLAATAGTQANQEAQNYLTAGQNSANIGQMEGNFNSIDTKNALDTANANINAGKAEQAAGLTGAAALDTIGREKMGETQKNLDLAYSDFEAQRDYTKNNVDWMSAVTRGQPSQGSTTATSSNAPLSGAQYGPSGLATLAGGLTAASSLTDALKKADGGYIDAAEVKKVQPRKVRAGHGGGIAVMRAMKASMAKDVGYRGAA